MRKFAVVGLAVLGLFAVVGIAYASNTYTSTSNTSPSKTGTSAKPTPVSQSLTFTVGETDPTLRPLPLKTYSIGLGGGIVPNTKLFPSCTFAQGNVQILPSACTKAVVGGGSVKALVGAPTNRATAASLKCSIKVTLLNSNKTNHLLIRLDTSGPSDPAFPCVTAQHSSIDATFAKGTSVAAKGGGKIPVYAIKFTVPDPILNPAGLATTVINNVSNIKKLTKTVKVHGKNVKHGYVESIGCPKTPAGKRVSLVTFTDTSGTSFKSTSSSKCT